MVEPKAKVWLYLKRWGFLKRSYVGHGLGFLYFLSVYEPVCSVGSIVALDELAAAVPDTTGFPAASYQVYDQGG